MNFILDPSLVLYAPLHQLDGASFMSRDAYGHVCTVTGALWRPNGRTFDGTDDLITVPSETALDNAIDGASTLLAWINPASDGEGDLGRILDKSYYQAGVSDEAGGYVKLRLYQPFTGTDGQWKTTDAIVPINTWSCVGFTYDASATTNDAILYVNGLSKAVTEETGPPTETRRSSAGVDAVIGNRATAAYTFDGLIGEIWIYNRALNPLEIQHNYLATKERYR